MPKTRKPQPPKQGETDGKAVKNQLINKLLKKVLDKPTKTVYNIRKDVREVQDLWKEFIYSKDRIELNNSKGYHDHIRLMVTQRASSVKELCEYNNLPIPILAGGALRDLIWNCMPKDYDFFFNCAAEEEAYELIDSLCLAMNKHGGYEVGGPGDQYENPDGNFDGVYGVFNWGAQCQFIVGVWPECENHIYERFDLSVCEAEMDLETFDIVVSEDFLWSIAEKKIKNKRPESEYSKQRMDRMFYNLQLDRTGKVNNNPWTEMLTVNKWRSEYFVNFTQDGDRFEMPVRPEQ